MDFNECFSTEKSILMEGALGERLKREYHLSFDRDVAMAGLIYEEPGRKALTAIWEEYIAVARKYHLPFIATTPTRRANKERVAASKYDDKIICDNVAFLDGIRKSENTNMYIGGLMGCKGDAYKATEVLSIDSAKEFHAWQADLFAQAGADFLYAGIMPALSEAIGMAKAMEQTGLPYIISFMIRKNGKLIDVTTISDAMMQIDHSVKRRPLCYMTNCVHPAVAYAALSHEFNQTNLVRQKFRGIQANTSPLSPEELDGSADLKCSDALSLAKEIKRLSEVMELKIVGGCCGTDQSHIEQIAKGL